MNELDYKAKINKNTLDCWAIVLFILFVFYITEYSIGERSLIYVFVFLMTLAVPLVITHHVYRKDKFSDKIPYLFVTGYLLFYTFSLFTAKGVLNFVYIFPMISVLVVYCDKKLIISSFGITAIENMIAIMLENAGILQLQYEQLQHWKIQIGVIVVNILFLYKSLQLLILKNNLFSDAMDDALEDGLTGLKNVRFLDSSLSNRFNYAENMIMNIAFIDIDDFKKFNTRYGHTVGDKVLKSIADVLMKAVSYESHTYVIRKGGDEFIIVTRTMSFVDFAALMEKTKNKIRDMKFDFLDADDGVTISVGISSKAYDRKCKNFQELCDLADFRNHIAKDTGKDTIVSSTPVSSKMKK